MFLGQVLDDAAKPVTLREHAARLLAQQNHAEAIAELAKALPRVLGEMTWVKVDERHPRFPMLSTVVLKVGDHMSVSKALQPITRLGLFAAAGPDPAEESLITESAPDPQSRMPRPGDPRDPSRVRS